MGYSPWGRKEPATTERLHFQFPGDKATGYVRGRRECRWTILPSTLATQISGKETIFKGKFRTLKCFQQDRAGRVCALAWSSGGAGTGGEPPAEGRTESLENRRLHALLHFDQASHRS